MNTKMYLPKSIEELKKILQEYRDELDRMPRSYSPISYEETLTQVYREEIKTIQAIIKTKEHENLIPKQNKDKNTLTLTRYQINILNKSLEYAIAYEESFNLRGKAIQNLREDIQNQLQPSTPNKRKSK